MSYLLTTPISRRISSAMKHCRAVLGPGKTNIVSLIHVAVTTTDWNKLDDFFSFTRGRFVVDEECQMQRRAVHFDMNELVRVAARSVGAEYCVSVRKCPDGMYNKSFVLTLNDGQEVIAKVPNPNAGLPYYTTANEVATMSFVRNVLQTPVPKVHAWNSRADDAVRAEYIIMDKAHGLQLSEIWQSMKLAEKMQLRLNLALHQEKWLSISFRRLGALYFKQDWDHVVSEPFLYTNQRGQTIQDCQYTIGPMTGRDWSDAGRASLKCDRGPWLTTSEYRRAVGLRELLAISSVNPPPKQTVMICGPDMYQPSAAKKISAIESYLDIYETLLPENAAISASTLWHNDLHEENIFVDPNNPTQILSIIDWQSNDLLPLFDHNLDPAFVQYSGVKPDTLDPPKLQDVSRFSIEERRRATNEYFQQALFVASRKITSKKLLAAHQALEYQQSAAFDLLTIARRIHEFGEAHFRALMVESHGSWPDSAHVKDFAAIKQSLGNYDDALLAEIQDDGEKCIRGMEIMSDIRARLGPLWPDKDAVSHEQYHDVKAALRSIKEELIDEFAIPLEDRAAFEKLWPFDD